MQQDSSENTHPSDTRQESDAAGTISAASSVLDHSQLGHALIERDLFLLRRDLVHFNHGSFGTVPRAVFARHCELLREQESCPEIWFREAYYTHVDRSRAAVAETIKAPIEEVVLVENASFAVNSILRSFPFKKGDGVLVFSSAYKMVVDTLSFLAETLGVEVIEVSIRYPVRCARELIDSVEETLRSRSNVRMCVFSHISSMPSMIEPVQELTRLCQAQGATVLIDGAHAPGVLDIDVHAIGADFYTGNCHKWLFAPKGCAFLWVSPSAASQTGLSPCPQPVVISSSGRYDFVGRFAYTGTRDYTAFSALPEALQFIDRELGGVSKMREYCTTLLKKGCDLLVEQWGTYYLVPFEMQAFMANVILPLINTRDEAQQLQKGLMEKHKISAVFGHVFDREQREIHFIRVSAQVYLDMSDFVKLSEAVKSLLNIP